MYVIIVTILKTGSSTLVPFILDNYDYCVDTVVMIIGIIISEWS